MQVVFLFFLFAFTFLLQDIFTTVPELREQEKQSSTRTDQFQCSHFRVNSENHDTCNNELEKNAFCFERMKTDF